MNNFDYNYELLKKTRLSKKISAQNIATDLCLAERQIISMEENSLQYFPSESLKYVCLKKYIVALGLNIEDVIHNLDDVDPIPSLLKKT
jgi:cytoskeletal protein RodZ